MKVSHYTILVCATLLLISCKTSLKEQEGILGEVTFDPESLIYMDLDVQRKDIHARRYLLEKYASKVEEYINQDIEGKRIMRQEIINLWRSRVGNELTTLEESIEWRELVLLIIILHDQDQAKGNE